MDIFFAIEIFQETTQSYTDSYLHFVKFDILEELFDASILYEDLIIENIKITIE